MSNSTKSTGKKRTKRKEKTSGIDVDAVFEQMDLNHDGRISVRELIKASRILGMNPTREEAEQMIADCSPQQKGYVTKQEFTRLFTGMQTDLDSQVKEMREAFSVFDKDNSGFISREEIRTVLRMSGEDVSEAEIEDMLNKVDENGDGMISIEEFAEFMCEFH